MLSILLRAGVTATIKIHTIMKETFTLLSRNIDSGKIGSEIRKVKLILFPWNARRSDAENGGQLGWIDKYSNLNFLRLRKSDKIEILFLKGYLHNFGENKLFGVET